MSIVHVQSVFIAYLWRVYCYGTAVYCYGTALYCYGTAESHVSVDFILYCYIVDDDDESDDNWTS